MSDWGLRGRWFRRLVFAWIIGLTTTAAILDDTCCCCDCSGQFTDFAYPGFDTIDPMAQERIRSSEVVRAAVGEVTTVTVEEEQALSTPRIEQLTLAGTYERVYKIPYLVTGATGTMLFYVYAVARSGSWVIEAIQSEDGAHTDGTVPETEVYGGSSGGGGWD